MRPPPSSTATTTAATTTYDDSDDRWRPAARAPRATTTDDGKLQKRGRTGHVGETAATVRPPREGTLPFCPRRHGFSDSTEEPGWSGELRTPQWAWRSRSRGLPDLRHHPSHSIGLSSRSIAERDPSSRGIAGRALRESVVAWGAVELYASARNAMNDRLMGYAHGAMGRMNFDETASFLFSAFKIPRVKWHP